MADTKRDYYEVLGIDKNADDDAIKKAYRVLAKKYHPDMNPGDADAEAKFKEASEAYAVLSDPEKRQQYDQYGHAAFDGSGGFGGFDFNSADFSDIFEGLFGGMFGGFGGSGFGSSSKRNPNGPMKGADLRISMTISFEEAVFGVDKKFEMDIKDECESCHGTGAKKGTSPETCTKCGGKGQVIYTQQSFLGTIRNVQACPDCRGTGKIIRDKCPDCGGTGYTSSKKTIEVSIPAGIDNGQYIRISGKGEPGVNGGPRGDLRVEVRVKSHPSFQRQDTNIYSTVPISFAVAALGGEIFVDTVDGKVAYEVKPGTQTDTRIRLRGKGVPSTRFKDVRGDHYATLVVETPDKLSHEAKELLRQFDAVSGDSLNAVKNAEKNDGDGDNGTGKKKKFWK